MLNVEFFKKYFLCPQARPLNPLPEVFLLYMGRAAGFEPELLRFASGTATLPMSYARPRKIVERLPYLRRCLSLFITFIPDTQESQVKNSSPLPYSVFFLLIFCLA
jgi:hypothetical protein